MTSILVNPGSGAIPAAGDGWTNTLEGAVVQAREWLATMHRDGMTDVELLTGYRSEGGRWTFDFRHTVTDVIVEFTTHGIDNIPAYLTEGIFHPRLYWNGSSCAVPELEDFAAPGFRIVKTYVAESP